MELFGFGKKEKDKMKDGLEKTRTGFWGNILNTLTGSKIDDDLYDELEEQLEGKVKNVRTLGDAVFPRKIINAVGEGFHYARIME